MNCFPGTPRKRGEFLVDYTSNSTVPTSSKQESNVTTMPTTNIIESENSTIPDFYFENSTALDVPFLAKSHYYYKAAITVNNYYGLLLVGIGFIGNTISLLIMLQVRFDDFKLI